MAEAVPVKPFTVEEVNQMELAICAKDFWYFCRFVVTEDEERRKFRPFPHEFEYLHRFIDFVDHNDKMVILKPRRMMISLTALVWQLWKAKFSGTGLEGAEEAFYCGYSAQDEERADYQMNRLQAIHEQLPDWLKNFNPMVQSNIRFKRFEKGGKIQGFCLKQTGQQGMGFSAFIFDEIAWQLFARSTWNGLSPSMGEHGKLIGISTPNGEDGTGRFFFELWRNPDGYYDDIARYELNWDENPEHDQNWYVNMCKTLDPQAIQQFLHKSFISYGGKPVYPEFERNIHVLVHDADVIEGEDVFIGWDDSFTHQAATFWQRNSQGQWVGLAEVYLEDTGFDKFCAYVLDIANGLYRRPKCGEIHFTDPKAFSVYSQQARSGAWFDAQEIQRQWDRSRFGDVKKCRVYPGAMQTGDRNREGIRIKAIRRALEIREDGTPGIVFSPRMTMCCDGMGGGYHWSDLDTEVPEKNKYSHPIDTIQYIFSGFDRMCGYKRPDERFKKNTLSRTQRQRIGWRTGL